MCAIRKVLFLFSLALFCCTIRIGLPAFFAAEAKACCRGQIYAMNFYVYSLFKLLLVELIEIEWIQNEWSKNVESI